MKQKEANSFSLDHKKLFLLLKGASERNFKAIVEDTI